MTKKELEARIEELEARIEELEEELEALQDEYEQKYELDKTIKPVVNVAMGLMRGFTSKGLMKEEALELTKLLIMAGAKL